MGWFFQCVTVLCGIVAVGFGGLALLAGLYIACDFAEEHPSVMKRYLQRACYSNTLLLIGLYLLDSDSRTVSSLVPLFPTCMSIAAHVGYLHLLYGRNFPIISGATSSSVLIPFVATLVAHFLWFHHFVKRQKQEYIDFYQKSSYRANPTMTAMTPPLIASAWALLGFFTVLVWMVPVGLFVSVTLQEDCLPHQHTYHGGGPAYNYSSSSSSHTSSNVDEDMTTSRYDSSSHMGIQRRVMAAATTHSSSRMMDSSMMDMMMMTTTPPTAPMMTPRNKGMLMKQLLDRWWSMDSKTKSNKEKLEKRLV